MRIKDYFKNNIATVFINSNEKNMLTLNGRVPFFKALLFSLQHIFAMFIGNITPIILVFSYIGLFSINIPSEYLYLSSNAIQAAILFSGIATIVQVLFASKLPFIVGASITFVSLFCSFYKGTPYTFSNESIKTYYTILGSSLSSGIFMCIIGPFIKYLKKLIKPIVPPIVLIGIGLSVINVSVKDMMGGQDVLNNLINNTLNVPYFYYIILGFTTLFISIIISTKAKGLFKNLNLFIAILISFIISLFIPNMVNFSLLEIKSFNDVFSLARTCDFSKIIFDPFCIILTSLTYLVASIGEIGDSTLICKNTLNRDVKNKELANLIIGNGLISIIGSFFAVIPLCEYSQNAVIVSESKVNNRFIIFLCGIILVFTSIFLPLTNIFMMIPSCILGGAMIIIFSSIIVSGIKMISNLGFDEKNSLILALSIGLGFGLTLIDNLEEAFNALNLQYVYIMISNPVLNMFIISFVLSYLIKDKDNKNIISQ